MANDFVRDELAEEESGWTSYFDCPSASLLPDSSFDPYSTNDTSAYSSLLLLENLQLPHDSPPAQTALSNHFHDVEAESDHSRAGANSVDFPDDESYGSSTLSDADSLLGLHPRIIHSPSRSGYKHECKGNACRKATRRLPLPSDHLEDTATSSTSLDQISACYGEGGVSQRFQTLEALIPCLKEVACQESEEEMLNAIINHVQDLEQKVQLLSDVWRLSQEKHD